MTTELDTAIQRVTRALLDECTPIELHELGIGFDDARATAGRHRRRRVVGVGLVLAGAAAASTAIALARHPDRSDTVIVTETPATTSTATRVSSSVASSSMVPSSTASFRGELGVNDEGDDVKAVQQRLVDLRFDPGPVDGYFGQATEAAVWAFQKLVLDLSPGQATGVVTPELWARMQEDPLIAPRRPGITGTHVEIDLPRQVVVVYEGDAPVLITHMSSGDGLPWTDNVTIDAGTVENPGSEPITKVVAGDGVTPGGVFSVGQMYDLGDGWRTDGLGRMYKPVYFDGSIAIHGSSNVPNRPSSHGGVRIPMHIAESFGVLVRPGDPVFVFDGVQDPEFYGGGPPPFTTVTTPGAGQVLVPDVAGLTVETRSSRSPPWLPGP